MQGLRLRIMAMPTSWKIAAGAAGLILAIFAWNGFSRYLVGRHADEVTRESARLAELNAQKASERSRQYKIQLAADMEQRRKAILEIHQQVKEDSRQYQVAQAARVEQQRQEELRVKATYKLDASQRCAAGIVFNHAGASFTTFIGSDGQPVKCKGDMALQPLRLRGSTVAVAWRSIECRQRRCRHPVTLCLRGPDGGDRVRLRFAGPQRPAAHCE